MKPTHSIPEAIKSIGLVLCVLFTAQSGFFVASAQDLQFNDIVDTIPKPLISNQSTQKSEANYVRIIYLIPADSIEKPEYTLGLENAARHLQMWYYNALGQNKTFALHDPIVEVYQTPHEALWYSTNPNGNPFYYFWNNVLQDGFPLTGGMYNDPNNRWVFYMDANPGCDQCGGCGGYGTVVISANDLKGLLGYEIDKRCSNVVHSYKPCRYVGGLGHELGHALGLPHPPECDEDFPTCWDHDLMMYGYITYPDAYFNESDKTRLSYSPFIRNIDIEGLYYPTSCMELNDTCNVSTQSEKSIFCGDSILLEGKYQNRPGIYFDTLNSVADCDTIIVTYLSILNPPPNAEDVWICEGEPVPDLIATGENIQWYDDVDLSNLIHSGDTLKTGHTDIGTYTYYVTQTNLGCNESSPVTVTVTISPVPLSPTTKDTASCEGEYMQFLEAGGTNITWYSDTGLTHTIWSGNSFYVEGYPTEVGKNIFYVTQKIDNCESLAESLTYTINPLPQPPLTEDVSICHGDSGSLLIAKGENITWYRDTYSTTFIDSRDGQEYSAVRIGDQVWMAENLNYYTPSGSWYYDNDSITYAATYGRLYDFSAARNFCPSGWHLPGDSEWWEMIETLGGDSIAGRKLKEKGDAHWISPNSDATNLSGFTALPAGYFFDDTFFSLGEETNYWSSRVIWEMGNTFKLTYNSSEITQKRFYYEDESASVRCIKDQVYEVADFGDSLTLSITQIGTYPFYATQTVANCESPAESVNLQIHSIPFVDLGNDTTIFIDQTLTLDIGIPEYSYSWCDGSDLPRSQISGSALGLGDHTYWVIVTDTNLCFNSDSIVITVIDPMNLQFKNTSNSIEIYPNPVNDLIFVQTRIPGKYTIEITSINGKIIYSSEFSGSSNQIDLSYFRKGIYFIKVESKDIVTTEKIIKF
ncbi:MAG: FISUMP domain-containing protein [Bacteroidota bacterium]